MASVHPLQQRAATLTVDAQQALKLALKSGDPAEVRAARLMEREASGAWRAFDQLRASSARATLRGEAA